MAELGETDDHTELIPGDPEAIRGMAASWRGAGNSLADTGKGITGLDTGEWSGDAQQAFADYNQNTSPLWQGAGDAFQAAGDGVSNYANVLEWGQGQAGQAVQLWQSGQQQAATELLASARSQVASAGSQAGAVVEDATARVPDAALAAAPAPMMVPPSDPPNPWDLVVSAHPQPGTITATNARVHILYGTYDMKKDTIEGGHFYRSGVPGKTVFPSNWTEDDIIDAVTQVANNPDTNPILQDNDRYLMTGTVNGVTLDVVVDQNGDVVTAYPTSGPGIAVNDEDGNPQPVPNQNDDDPEKAEEEAGQESEDQAGSQAENEVQEAQAAAKAEAAANAEAEAAAEAAEAEAESIAESEALAWGMAMDDE